MPTITADGPPIRDMERKRSFVREVTESAVKAYGLPKEAIVVVLKENLPENVAVGGQLISDRKKD